jgi:RNA-directed DNA polymerase
LGVISSFLKDELKLEIVSSKTFFRKWHQGIDFLGYVVFPCYSILRPKTKKRMFAKVERNNLEFLREDLCIEKMNQSIQSYLGLLSHANEYKTRLKIIG